MRPGAYRNAAGAPGPQFWQNRADYAIKASIDTATHALAGDETITYTNHSPGALDVLWVQLDQNIYRRDARTALNGRFGGTDTTEGFQLEAVQVDGKPARYLVDDTRLRVDLPRPLPGGGRQLKLHIRYHYTVPGVWGGRTAVTATKNGDIYEIAQWYPRMAVYDDLRGWDTLPYLGAEFYLEYGSFDYAVTVPWNFPRRRFGCARQSVRGADRYAAPAPCRGCAQRRLGLHPQAGGSHRPREPGRRSPVRAPGASTWNTRATWLLRLRPPLSGTPRASICRKAGTRWQLPCIQWRRRARINGAAPPNT